MLASTEVPRLIARTLDWIRAFVNRDSELALMSQTDLRMLATDIGVTEADLRDVVPRIGDHSELLEEMMRARGLDPDAVRHAFSAVIHDMEVTCARCRDSGICRRSLEAGTIDARSRAFCGNAETIDELLSNRG